MNGSSGLNLMVQYRSRVNRIDGRVFELRVLCCQVEDCEVIASSYVRVRFLVKSNYALAAYMTFQQFGIAIAILMFKYQPVNCT